MIDKYHFGHMKVNGQAYSHDLKIIQGQVKGDWWRKEGHRLDTNDIRDILSADPDILVVGTGDSGQMKVQSSLRSALETRRIKLIAEPTAEAAKTFNALVDKGKSVAGAFHLTC